MKLIRVKLKEEQPDYFITRVSYDKEHSHIINVKLLKDMKTNMPEVWKKDDIIKAIKEGKVFFTYKNGERAKVEPFPIDGKVYLRTDKNSTPKDNLGNLPEF